MAASTAPDAAPTPAGLLAAARAADPSGPFLTFYDDATGERVELSLTTLDNWVAKTANLLQDELGAVPGERVGVLLPPHWQGAVWLLAAWSVGLVVDLAAPTTAEVVATTRSRLPTLPRSGSGGGPVRAAVVLGLRPLGLPPPPGAGAASGGGAEGDPALEVVEYDTEVLAQGDRFAPYSPVGAEVPALVSEGGVERAGRLVEAASARAGELGLAPGRRLLTTADPAGPGGYLDALLAPLAARCSVVLVRRPDPEQQAARIAAERVDVVVPAS